MGSQPIDTISHFPNNLSEIFWVIGFGASVKKTDESVDLDSVQNRKRSELERHKVGDG